MDWKTTIAELIEGGLTQSEISRRTHISQSFISELANGQKTELSWSFGEALRKLHRRTCKARRKPAPSTSTQEG